MGTPFHSKSPAALVAKGLRRTFGSGDVAVQALADVNVAFLRGQFTAITGASGSGKSTLLHCLAGLDAVDAGSIRVGGGGGVELTGLNDRDLTLLRRNRFGFVFQSFNLIPVLDAEANIRLPLDLAGRRVDPSWFGHVVDTLGLGDRLTHWPHELSGGQQQRVAIARALITRPDVIFADEPTGNLDSHTASEVLNLLARSAHENEQTIVMATHDPLAAARAERVVVLRDGSILADLDAPLADQLVDVAANPAPVSRVVT